MLIKVSEATPLQLDYMVAYIMGVIKGNDLDVGFILEGGYTPSTDWAQGGPIIERERIEICHLNNGEWRGQLYEEGIDKMHREYGDTPLIAAMRCYVVAKWNDEVEIPEELKCQD